MFKIEEPEIFYAKKENFPLKDENYKQTINYLAVSKLALGLILNFGEDLLTFKRGNFIKINKSV